MASDRARSTYDKSKQYRRVVPQQGRVILEADLNEASEIAAEESRHQILEIVGPYGVPRDAKQDPGTGYALGVDAEGDFTIGAGAIYVGGLRVHQDDPGLRCGKQKEGLEKPAFERALPHSDEGHPYGVAHLYLREQEVSATEDTSLLDVALGGPDTAQRVRLIRKVVHSRASSAHPDAVGEVISHLERSGYVVDPCDMRLRRTARLRVNRRALQEADDPRGHLPRRSYLGAENQLIRIQISSNKKSILWSYDNASSLYRADLSDGADRRTLTLRSAPVDEHHEPRTGQVVEILESTAILSEDDAIASVSGVVRVLALPYEPGNREIVLTAPIPNEWARTTLFVRVWENEHTFELDEPVLLLDSRKRPIGIDVTLTDARLAPQASKRDLEEAKERFVPGDFWSFAVRPMEPTRIDPPRYREPQPPEGPREWTVPLALLDFGKHQIEEDLRPTFENLVRVDQRTEDVAAASESNVHAASRVVTVTEGELTSTRGLRTIIDEHIAELAKGIRVTILLEPGTYCLHAPIRLDKRHSGLTIEGRGATLEGSVQEGALDHIFNDGLIVGIGAHDITLRGLDFALAWSAYQPSWLNLADVVRGSIAIRAANCDDLVVEDCRFVFPKDGSHHTFGAAIFGSGQCRGLTVTDCRFEAGPATDKQLTHVKFGYLLAPSIVVVPSQKGPFIAEKGTFVRSRLTEAVFRSNVFTGMSSAALILADMGTVRFERNRVRDSYGGFWLFSTGTAPLWGSPADPMEFGLSHLSPVLFEILGVVQDPIIQLGIALAQLAHSPLATNAEENDARHEAIKDARAGLLRPLLERARSWLQDALFDLSLLKGTAPAQPAGLSLTAIALASSAVAVGAQDARRAPGRFELGPFTLHLADNDIIVGRKGEEHSGSGILVWTTDDDPEATAIVSANQVRNSSHGHPALMMLTLAQAVVTGNVVVNEARPEALAQGWLARAIPFLAAVRKGLGLHPHTRMAALILPSHGPGANKDPIAITGNVFGGTNSLPSRPNHLPPWKDYNSTV